MSLMTGLILVAMLGVAASLILGVSTMAKHKEIGHHTGEQWMFMRIGFQAVALILMGLAILASRS